MKKLLNKIIDKIAKFFLGSNIGHYFPWLVDLYFGVKKRITKSLNSLTKLELFDKKSSLWVDAEDSLVGLELQLKGSFEEKEAQRILTTLKEGDVFIDVGANIGYFTILVSNRVGNSGKVIAVEPDPYNLTILQKNIELNKAENIQVFIGAAGRNHSYVNLVNESDHGQTQLNYDAKGDTRVESLAHIINMNKIDESIKFLKIDVEGGEMEVLQGAIELFEQKRIENIMIEINPNKLIELGTSKEEIIGLLNKYFDLDLAADSSKLVNSTNIETLCKGTDYINVWGSRKR